MTERIAVLTTSFPRAPGDAAGHFVASEVQRLAQSGHEVHVFAPGQGAPLTGLATLHWVGDRGAFGWPGALARLKERPARWLGVCEFALRVELELRRLGPWQRIQAHFLVPSGWPLATLARAPALELIGHGSDVRLFCALPRPLRCWIAQRWLGRELTLRVTSDELATQLIAASPELAQRLSVAPSPLDFSEPSTRQAARRALAIPDRAEVALVVSRLVPEKRVEVALRALSLVSSLSVLVVGDGPELPRLRARFPAVRFVGYVPRPEALRFIAAADVLVSASANEGAPSAVREARALGVKVVSVAAGDLLRWAERDPDLFVIEA